MLSFLMAGALAVEQPIRYALLVGVATPKYESPSVDCALMEEALERRGWRNSEIHRVVGDLTVAAAGKELLAMKSALESHPGSMAVLFVSAEGSLDSKRLLPSISPRLGWSELFQFLGGIKSARFEVLADAGYTNLLVGRTAPNCSVVAMDGTWRDIRQKRSVGEMVHRGRSIVCGVGSYVMSRELPYATTMADLAARVSGYKQSGSMGAIWFDSPVYTVIGPGLWPVPGEPLRR